MSFILLLIVTSAWLRTAKDLRPRWWLISQRVWIDNFLVVSTTAKVGLFP